MLRTIVCVLFLIWPAISHAETRIALVIGNTAYQKANTLTNATNDARAISNLLLKAGFNKVLVHENLGIRELRQAIREFSDLIREADVAVVYYSGHGIDVNGVDYLVPTDAVLDRDLDVPYEAYALSNLMQALEPAKRLRLVMLDACRDNPFVRTIKRTVGSRTVGQGLASIEPASVNTLISFAAKAGSVALDVEGSNSPYAAAILHNLATPNLDVRVAFGRVRDEVLKTTSNKQEPFLYGSLGSSEIALVVNPEKPKADAPPAAAPPNRGLDYDKEIEISFWNTAKDARSKPMLESYLERYPNGSFAPLARVLIAQIDAATRPRAEPKTAADLRKEEEIRVAALKAEEARRAAELKSLQEQQVTSTDMPLSPNTDRGQSTPSSPPNGAGDQVSLIKSVQSELKRVGCSRGEIDGVWGPQTKASLADFSRARNLKLEPDQPTLEMLQALQGQKDRVCQPVVAAEPKKVPTAAPNRAPPARQPQQVCEMRFADTTGAGASTLRRVCH